MPSLFNIITSAALHLAIAAIVAGGMAISNDEGQDYAENDPAPDDEKIEVREELEPSEIVIVPPPPEKPPEQNPPEQNPPAENAPEGKPQREPVMKEQAAESPPIDYASTKKETADEVSDETESTAAGANATNAAPRPPHEWRIAGDVLNRDGFQAPAIRAELTPDQMDWLVVSGFAVYRVDLAPNAQTGERRNTYHLRAELSEGEMLDLAADSDTRRYSVRAIPISGQRCRSIHDKLKFSFGVKAKDIKQYRVNLVFTNQLDRLILDRQLNAMEQFNVAPTDVIRTSVSFDFSARQLVNVRITTLHTTKGDVIQLPPETLTEQ